jgi:hypothetical protein
LSSCIIGGFLRSAQLHEWVSESCNLCVKICLVDVDIAYSRNRKGDGNQKILQGTLAEIPPTDSAFNL